MADPYANEPKRHRALLVRSAKPFNAETPTDALGSGPTTPNELFYVRNHLPVPHVEPAAYSVSLPCSHASLTPGRQLCSVRFRLHITNWIIPNKSCVHVLMVLLA